MRTSGRSHSIPQFGSVELGLIKRNVSLKDQTNLGF